MSLSNRIFSVVLAVTLVLVSILVPATPVSAASSTSVTIIRLAIDGKTINRQISLTYQEMESTLPVYGDGTTHYYDQGPIFSDNESERWNPEEDKNVEEKDKGAVLGTNLKDLCDLVGRMSEGDEVKLIATDKVSKTFAYQNVYEYSDREGPIVLTWCKDGMYPDTGYDEGMRIVWFADTSVNPWGYHVFGIWDWHEAADEKYWHYYNKEFPTTTGLSVQKVKEITIFSSDPPFWDPDADGTCNTGDIEAIGSHWHEEGEPGWIAEDVNRDGVVNILDGVKVGMHWEEEY
jgi:hypothetical protein